MARREGRRMVHHRGERRHPRRLDTVLQVDRQALRALSTRKPQRGV